MSLKHALLLGAYLLSIQSLFSQEPKKVTAIPLNDLSAFKVTGTNWTIGSDAFADLEKEEFLQGIAGQGVLINNRIKGGSSYNIHTQASFEDLEIEFDYLIAKGANSGIYLQGRYEVQLRDSWGKLRPSSADNGGLYQRYIEKEDRGYQGMAPVVNVARAPGLWQHIKIRFRAPRFDQKGTKIQNARFEEVELNGVTIHEEVEVTGPTQSAMFEDERKTGPIMIQGDHGNVAIRNIRYSIPDPAQPQGSTPEKLRLRNPILVNPLDRPYLLRSFLTYNKKTITHAISLGHPNQLNFSYDLKQGALLQIWRGKFADATDIWHQRGEPYQRIVPQGSVIPLSGSPALAVLKDPGNSPWPDSISFDQFKLNGYVLDKERMPTFQYAFNGVEVKDKISVIKGKSIERTLSVTNAPSGMYCRIAVASKIEKVRDHYYAIGDKTYFLALDTPTQPTIRNRDGGQELLIPVSGPTSTVSYSIIW